MKYTQLSNDYKYDTLASAVYAREVEYFHYDFDRLNFEHLITNPNDSEFVQGIVERLDATRKQMANVLSIIEALNAQIDDREAYEAAVVRVTAKREEKEAE